MAMERLKAALESLDRQMDGLEDALNRRLRDQAGLQDHLTAAQKAKSLAEAKAQQKNKLTKAVASRLDGALAKLEAVLKE